MPAASIMIVEDERIVAFNLQQQLQRMGYEVPATAASGEEALRRAREAKPSLVLMDIRIDGDPDGIETARRLRQESSVPVIYLTAYSGDETLERARTTRPYGYLLKPFSERELQATILMALGRREVEIELEEKRAQLAEALAELARLNEELEERVRERTAELRTAFRDLESFSAAVAHDLRSPLRAILRQLGLVRSSPGLPAASLAAIERALAAASGMEKIIEGLLELARVSRVPVKRAEVDLTAMARGIFAELQAGEPHRSARLRAEDGLRAVGDRDLLRIALADLLQNAWKFTSKRPRAEIEFGAREEGGETVYYVRDNGAGFDMQFAGKLFSEFRRLHAATEFEGTGIGLATVRRIVHRHGGRAWAEGAEGKGATFYFTLESPAIDARGA